MRPSPRASRRDPRAAIARDIWRLTAIAWKAFCAALLPLPLATLPRALPKLLEHLAKYRQKHRRFALEKARDRLHVRAG